MPFPLRQIISQAVRYLFVHDLALSQIRRPAVDRVMLLEPRFPILKQASLSPALTTPYSVSFLASSFTTSLPPKEKDLIFVFRDESAAV